MSTLCEIVRIFNFFLMHMKKKLILDIDSRSFNQRVAFNMHIRIHTGELIKYDLRYTKDFISNIFIRRETSQV